MPTEFHLFSALPTELRQEIWKLVIAVRPKPAGVRVFRVFDASQEPSIRLEDVPGYRPYKRHPLGLPLPGKDFVSVDGESMSDISTQIYDPGLWNACHESRFLMKEAFVSVKEHGHASIGYYLSGSAPFYVTLTNQGHNLFILRPDSLEFDLSGICGAFSRMDLVLGIEYRPEWGSQLCAEEQGGEFCLATGLMAVLGGDTDIIGVYLVDYNLKLKADSPRRPKAGELSCYYARDRRLVDVYLDHENERDHWEYIEPVPDKDEKSSFAFAEQLHAYYEEMQDRHQTVYQPSIGLLGWDNY
ncbi:hypothetical protein H9Q72_006994 [Fusarium xylarioides]|uniref:2EXR domain-containing protein n=1 Tax=Fusarium xylarioides TaxID=221167 RepID=A0A9P7IA32_9HYPO|nr:hypothetical protein H9Q72_006994 [Fusarium xylarioides]KAG5803655.1 hypothetical protein H9Q71_011758 [Fusarium xylarioides]KAG5814852.1 hypothetical protein H9Q74_012006 [Fusarium xylarioides]